MPLPTPPFCSSLGSTSRGDRLRRLQRSPYFRDGRFWNATPTHKLLPGTGLQAVRHQLLGKEVRRPTAPIPIVPLHAHDFAIPPVSGLRAVWFGHASSLVEIDGTTILIDPVWSERCSPFRLVGPRRFHPPPVALRDLPQIDVVLLSHDHYDHLDYPTIRSLAKTSTQFVTALGVGAHLEAWGIAPDRITELEWGEQITVNDVRITAARAQHFSGRRFTDENATFWASWVFHGPAHRVFYSGDTGYFDASDIGAQYGPFDLTLIAIGAYNRAWPHVHLNPEEAVKMQREVKGRLLLPVHWGTFNLGFHDWREPAEWLVHSAAQSGVSVCVPRPGEFVDLAHPPSVTPWWHAHGAPPALR